MKTKRKINLDEGTKVHLGILLYGIALVILMCFIPKTSTSQTLSDVSKVMGQNISMTYDSATILLSDKTIELEVYSKVTFDPNGFTLSTSDNRIYTYIVPGSEFDTMPTRKFCDMDKELYTITNPKDSTTTSTMLYQVVGYEKNRIGVVRSKEMHKQLYLLKGDNTGIILH